MIRKTLVVLFIPLKLFFLVTLQPACNSFFVTIFVKHAIDHKQVGPRFYLLAIDRVKVTFAQRQVMYRVQQIGFTRTVITSKGINTLAEIQFSLAVILKVDNG